MGVDARNGVGTSGNGSLAGLAVPDTGRVSSDGGLSAESAGVLGVLRDLHLLHLLSQGGTVTVGSRSVLCSSWIVAEASSGSCCSAIEVCQRSVRPQERPVLERSNEQFSSPLTHIRFSSQSRHRVSRVASGRDAVRKLRLTEYHIYRCGRVSNLFVANHDKY